MTDAGLVPSGASGEIVHMPEWMRGTDAVERCKPGTTLANVAERAKRSRPGKRLRHCANRPAPINADGDGRDHTRADPLARAPGRG